MHCRYGPNHAQAHAADIHLYTYLASVKRSRAVWERAQLMTDQCVDLSPSAGTLACISRLLLMSA